MCCLPCGFEQVPTASGEPHQVLHTLVRTLWGACGSEPQGAGQGGVPAQLPSVSVTSITSLAHAESRVMPASEQPSETLWAATGCAVDCSAEVDSPVQFCAKCYATTLSVDSCKMLRRISRWACRAMRLVICGTLIGARWTGCRNAQPVCGWHRRRKTCAESLSGANHVPHCGEFCMHLFTVCSQLHACKQAPSEICTV